MNKGKVKFFNKTKMFGFITKDDGSGDIFFHKNQCNGPLPTENDRVSFTVNPNGKKGECAEDVTIIK